MNSGQATRDPVGTGSPWQIRIGLGMFGARRRRAGDKPGDSAQQGSGRARIDAATGPGPPLRGCSGLGSRRWRFGGRGAPAWPPRAERSAPLGRRGKPSLHWPAAPRFPPPSVEPAMGGRPPPMCRPGRGSRRTVSVTGVRSAPASSAGQRVRGGRRDNAIGAPGRAGTAGRGPGRTGAPPRPRIRVTCPVAHSRSTRPGERRLLRGAVGCSDVVAAAQAPGKPPRVRDPLWRDGPGHPNHQVCETGTNRARPTRSTTTISHPRPPNTAITTTAPPPCLLRHSQPAITPRTIQAARPSTRCGRRFIRTIRLHPSARQALGSEYE